MLRKIIFSFLLSASAVIVDQNGRMNVVGDVAGYSVYGIDGNQVRADESLTTGIYIVAFTMNDGSRRTAKIVVR